MADVEEKRSRFRQIFFQDFFPFDIAVEIDGATRTGTLAQRSPIFPHLKTRPPGELKCRAFLFPVAIEDIPARGQHHEVAEAGQREPALMDQAVDLIDLGHIKVGIETVVGILLS